MSMLLILTWLVPLAAAALTPFSRFWWLPAVAAVPALVTAAVLPVGYEIEIPWLLLGTTLGMNETDRIFLAFTSVLWFAAGIYGAGSMRGGVHGGRFRSFFLLAMAGNLWLIVGLDVVSFYVGFSLMGIASYGLVVHEEDRPALRAGKIYLVMTLVGELALFVALVLIAHHAGGLVPQRADLVGLGDLTVGLLILGLAIKAGLVPVHVWLPLAHPAAPVPASAVLSGAMIKVALLGWLRFLPVGEVALVEWGMLLLMAGLLTLFYAIPIGLVQSNPKVILAYSSVSKMGLMALAMGLILLEPGLAPAGILSLCLYAAHHALVKGGLFLGVGLRQYARAQVLVLAGITLLALSLAAIPPSGGAVAKYGIKPTLAATDWSWLTAAVSLSTAGTALLMARFMWVIWRTEPHPSHGQLLGGIGWAGLVALSLLFPLLFGNPAAWVTNVLPTGITLAILAPVALVARRRPHLLRLAVNRVPAGDLLGLVRPLLAVIGFASRSLGLWWRRWLLSASSRLDASFAAVGPAPNDPERRLRSWPNVGTAWLVVMALPLVFSVWTQPDPRPWEQAQVVAHEPAGMHSNGEPAMPIPKTDGQSSTPDEGAARTPTPKDVTPGGLTVDNLARPNPVPPRRPSERAVPDAGTAVAVAISEQASDEGAAKGLEPQAELAEPEPMSAAASVKALAAKDTADTASGEESCSPERVFVFGHPEVAAPLLLKDCVQGPDGPARLRAPPLTNRLIDLVQRHLNGLGYDAGPVDGLIGPRTRAAVRRFQTDRDKAPTGAITFALLEGLVESTGNYSERAPARAAGE